MRRGHNVLKTIVQVVAFAALWAGLSQAAPGGPPAPGRRPRPVGPPPLLRALDKDGDGKLSTSEIAEASASLKQLDRNGDGSLSREELLGRRRPVKAAGRPPRGGPSGMRPVTGVVHEADPLPKDEMERKILEVLADMDRTQRRGMMNVPREDGRLLRLLAEAIGAKRVVEIGTSNGYSGLWICLALQRTGGKLITHEIDERRASLARKNFARAGVSDLVTIVMGDAHKTITKLKGPIDMVFIDADKRGYADYLKKLLPFVRPGGLIVAHNMHRPPPYPDFIKAVTTDPTLETLFFHMEAAGIGVTLKKR